MTAPPLCPSLSEDDKDDDINFMNRLSGINIQWPYLFILWNGRDIRKADNATFTREAGKDV